MNLTAYLIKLFQVTFEQRSLLYNLIGKYS